MRFMSEHGSRPIEQSRQLRALLSLNLFALCALSSSSASSSSSSSDTAREVFLHSRTPPQCLYLDEGVAPHEACGVDKAPHVRLRFCDAYALGRLLPEGAPCDAPFLARMRDLDERARRVACKFRRLLRRFDCDTENSVSWTCSDCELAYKQWVCSMFLPKVQVAESGALKPCRYICRMVEQRCPYFHPSVKEQYAGERVFKCIDPDIPDLDTMVAASTYGPSGRCYCPHHLEGGKEEGEAECRLLTPSQLRRNASRKGAAPPVGPPPPLLLLTLLLFLLLLATTR